MGRHEHPDEHAHEHDHDRDHEHVGDNDEGHEHGKRRFGSALRHALFPYSHDTVDQVDPALETSADGIRALRISLFVLGSTAMAQAVVVGFTGSVALLGDTMHNVADALTAVPLWFAFTVGRRPPNRRYTYGYGRAEDVAGIAIVLTIAASAILAGYEAVDRLLHPSDVRHVPWLVVAALVGFAGNEIAARVRINAGRRIGSAALIADGLHARTDGFTSLAVLFGALGVAVGVEQADPVIGLLISLAIARVLAQATKGIYYRLMDAVDPAILEHARDVVSAEPGVENVDDLRLRWIGHRLRAEVEVAVDPALALDEAHEIAHRVHHALLHGVARLDEVIVHPSPVSREGFDAHASLAHHADGQPHDHRSESDHGYERGDGAA